MTRLTPPGLTRAGFTLIEMVVSLAITTLIFLSCGSLMILGARAAEGGFGGDSVTAQTLRARSAADQICADLEVATMITEQTASTIAFRVPDRDGDSIEESIRYEWDQATGNLNRTINGVTAAITHDVSAFSFAHVLVAAVSGSDTGAKLITIGGSNTGKATTALPLTNNNWAAQYVYPSHSWNAVSWSVSSVEILINRNAANTGTVTASVHLATAQGKPTGPALGSGSVDITTVSTTPEWVNISISGVTALAPWQEVAIVFSTTASAPASLHFFNPISDSSLKLTTSTDAGVSWATPNPKSALEFKLYGTETGG